MKSKFLLLLLLGIVIIQKATSQVVINEYSAANWKQFTDNHNDYEDWIELYNTSSVDASIANFWLSDDDKNVQKFQFPLGTTIPPNGFIKIWCSGRNLAEAAGIHANFKLTQTNKNAETLILANAVGNIVSQVVVAKTTTHQSRCRSTDGGSDWKICTEPTPGSSNNGSITFSRFAEKPDMDISAGFYSGEVTVTITNSEPNSTVYYTLNGTEPTLNSAVYSTPLTISNTRVLKAKTFSNDSDVLPSFLRFNTYFINENYSLPVFSVAADQLQELANGNKGIRPIGSLEYFDKEKVRKNSTYGELNSHGQDSWVNDQRSLDWISRDEMGYSKAISEPLFAATKRADFQRVIFRAAGDDNYPATSAPYHQGSCHLRDDYVQTLAQRGGMDLDVRTSERCILYLNGDYWGVYSLREIPDDHDYTDYNYDQGKYDIQYLATWGNTWAEYGGDKAHKDWAKLRKFIMQNDMADPANYQVARDSINLISMIDYFATNLNVVASDWLNYNTGWWRGLNPQGNHKKWGYILWDLDATFDYYINYSGVPNTKFNANPCDLISISSFVEYDFFNSQDVDTCINYINNMGDSAVYCQKPDGKHQLILLRLIQQSPAFKQLYYQRMADLQNTVFSCDNMLSLLDEMAGVIDPEMPKHIARWGGSYTKWQQNIQKMRNFISQRCEYYSIGMKECYPELSGPYPVTLMVEPAGAGEIQFNTINIKNFPWTGEYFNGMEQRIEANAKTALPFSHWETKKGSSITPNLNTDIAQYTLTEPDTLIAVFGAANSTNEANGSNSFSIFPSIATDHINTLFTLKNSVEVQLSLLNSLGQIVAAFPLGKLDSGNQQHKLEIESLHLPSGMYTVKLQAGNLQMAKKVVISN